MVSRRIPFPSYLIHKLVNPILDRTYFIIAYEVHTMNFIKVSYKRSIAFLFDKNSLRNLNDIKRHEM